MEDSKLTTQKQIQLGSKFLYIFLGFFALYALLNFTNSSSGEVNNIVVYLNYYIAPAMFLIFGIGGVLLQLIGFAKGKEKKRKEIIFLGLMISGYSVLSFVLLIIVNNVIQPSMSQEDTGGRDFAESFINTTLNALKQIRLNEFVANLSYSTWISLTIGLVIIVVGYFMKRKDN